jgi:hypothetical protein
MKKLINICIGTAFLLLIGGCTPATFQKAQTPKPLKNEITIVTPKDSEDKRVWIKHDSSAVNKSIKEIDYQLAETFYAAAVHGKRLGYSYFAITAESMNNLSGFPINNFNNIVQFCNWEKENKAYRPGPLCYKKGIIGYSVELEVKYFKNPIPGLFLYNIDEVITQTEKYL